MLHLEILYTKNRYRLRRNRPSDRFLVVTNEKHAMRQDREVLQMLGYAMKRLDGSSVGFAVEFGFLVFAERSNRYC